MNECNGIPQQGYGEFSDWLHKRVGDQRIPISGTFEVTLRCNLRCQHCYIPIEQRASHHDRELSLPEIRRILDEITDAGCLWLLLTGGEPLLRRDFLDIYSYAKGKGLILTLFTNGTMLTPRIADYLAKWRPFKIEITLYGASQKTYEQVTGIPGSYKRCMRGIELLLERNLPLGLKTMVMTINQHELDQMKLLAAHLGVQFRFDPIIDPAIDGSVKPTTLRLTPREIVAVENGDPERSSLWREQFKKIPEFPLTDPRMYLCSGGKQGFHINSAGQLSQCLTARQTSYNLLNGSFREGWEIFLAQVIARQYNETFPCVRCELRRLCAQCPEVAGLELHDSQKRVEFLCQVTKLRRDVFAEKK